MEKFLIRTLIYIALILLIGYTSYSQSLSVFNVNATTFPTIKADFFAFDSTGNRITNLTNSDFTLTENGQLRTVTNISCPSPKPPIALSSVLVMDLSASMLGERLEIAKAAANAWVNMLNLGQSECALTSFSINNYLNQDFTTDKKKLLDAINNLVCDSGTDYNAAMINQTAGGILIAKTGKHKRIIIFLTDGKSNAQTKDKEIISEAKANNIIIYSVSINMPAPQCVKDFADQTGGLYFENIVTKEEAEQCYMKILMSTQEIGDPCEIKWLSDFSCTADRRNIEVKLKEINGISKASYLPPSKSAAKLEYSPPSVRIINAIPGIKRDTTITVTAINAGFNITNIISSNPAFTINPTNFVLPKGQSLDIKVSYLPADSGYTYCKFTFENSICSTNYFASGGFPGKKPKIQTLKIIQPNGAEAYVVGSDTIITWEGVLPDEKVKIEYTTNNGANWLLISDSATGLGYNWTIPKTPSNQCLARVTTYSDFKPRCDEIIICDQIWMGCNLNVDHYRNGDSIPEVRDADQLKNLTTGGWCHYNNDTALGIVYGKLYNWYAVNDPRGLAPVGWHIPNEKEWLKMEQCLGSSKSRGGKLKSTGTVESEDGLWYAPNEGATNETSFSALPAGLRNNKGLFYRLGIETYFWSSTEYYSSAVIRALSKDGAFLITGNLDKDFWFSVRCLRD